LWPAVAGSGLKGGREPRRRVVAGEFPTLVEPVPGAAGIAQQGAVGQRVAGYLPQRIVRLESEAGGEQGQQGIVVCRRSHRLKSRSFRLPHARKVHRNRGGKAAASV
jgi:hypothetical protein